MIKKFTSILLILIFILTSATLCGCSSKNFYLYFAIDTMPYNIDPQKAETYGELLAVRNCFRGLTKYDKNGNAVLDLAKTYTVSNDGLVYTFTLNDATWSNGEKVTADDFLFAVERATDPITASPNSPLLECISGAAERLNGNTEAVLGISSPDPQTIVYTLTKPDSTFLSTLTRAIFMPCNREYFESCGGKYGLDRKHILTNGTYYVSQWLTDRHLKLSLAKEVSERQNIAENVFLTVSAKNKTNVQRIIDREVGITVDSLNDYSKIDTSKFTVYASYLKSYCLVINPNTDFGANTNITAAFAQSINHARYTVNMSERFKTATTVLPENCIVFDSNIDTLSTPKYSFEYDAEKSRNDFLTALKELPGKKLPDIQVLTVDSPEIKTILTNIVSQWQSNLGAYVNIKTVSTETELNETVNEGNFTIALVPFSGNAYEILKRFSDTSSALYLNDPKFDLAVQKLHISNDSESARASVNTCLQILSDNSRIIPIINTPTAFIYDIEYENVRFSIIDGTVDFSCIYKK